VAVAAAAGPSPPGGNKNGDKKLQSSGSVFGLGGPSSGSSGLPPGFPALSVEENESSSAGQPSKRGATEFFGFGLPEASTGGHSGGDDHPEVEHGYVHGGHGGGSGGHGHHGWGWGHGGSGGGFGGGSGKFVEYLRCWGH